MRTVLIGAVGSTELVLRAMNDAGQPPVLLATYDPETGRRHHGGDYVDLAAIVDPRTEVIFVRSISDPGFIARVAAVEPDTLFVIGWSQMVLPELRATARRYCIGYHPTLLPAMRGRAAIGWTILLGLTETGATLFHIEDEVDSGPILEQVRIALDERETVTSLAAKLSVALDRMIRDLLLRLADDTAVACPQPVEGISYCARRTAADNLIDWRAEATNVDRLIRASTRPYAGAFTFTRKRRITIWSAEPVQMPNIYFAHPGQVVDYVDGDPIVRCGDGAYLRLTEYEGGGVPLVGQIRFRNRQGEEE